MLACLPAPQSTKVKYNFWELVQQGLAAVSHGPSSLMRGSVREWPNPAGTAGYQKRMEEIRAMEARGAELAAQAAAAEALEGSADDVATRRASSGLCAFLSLFLCVLLIAGPGKGLNSMCACMRRLAVPLAGQRCMRGSALLCCMRVQQERRGLKALLEQAVAARAELAAELLVITDKPLTCLLTKHKPARHHAGCALPSEHHACPHFRR